MDEAIEGLVASHLRAMDEAWERYSTGGWCFARVVTSESIGDSEAARRAVEVAHWVLAHFDEEGSLKAGADDAAVIASIAMLVRRAKGLLGPEERELLRRL